MLRYISMIGTGICILASSLLSCQETQSELDSLEAIQLRDFDTVGVEQALSEWRRDSLGCLKLRGRRMAQYLTDKLELEKKSYSQIISLLGTPNEETVKKGLLDLGEEEFLYLNYYYEIQCKDGKPMKIPLGYCWMSICIHPETKKVVSIVTSCS